MHAFRSAFRARDAKKRVDERDEHGDRIIAGRRNMPRRGVLEQQLRAELAEDVRTLLNSVNLGSALDLSGLPYVSRSILNFGLDDLSSVTIDEDAVAAVGRGLKDVLCRFEPRLLRSSVRVEKDTAVHSTDMIVRFLVRADMRCDPLDVPIEFVADLELESAKVRIFKL